VCHQLKPADHERTARHSTGSLNVCALLSNTGQLSPLNLRFDLQHDCPTNDRS
jgi:hypothetical protein